MVETSNSVPFVQFDLDEKKKTKVSLTIRNQSPPRALIAPSFFDNLSVFVSMPNKELTEMVHFALSQRCAVQYTISPILADIVVSDQNFVLPSLPNTRGRKLLKNIKLPHIVTLEQIPWVYQTIIQSTQYTTKTPKAAQVVLKNEPKLDRIVVADIQHHYRPIIKNLEFPKLYFPTKKIKGYTISPFNPIPSKYEEAIRKSHSNPTLKETPKNPPEHGFCELCQICYDDPVEHHNSFSHKRNSDMFRWMEFDQLSSMINFH